MTYLIRYVFQINTENLDLSVFSIITRINELKTLTEHISCECKCKFDEEKCNSNQWWNNNKWRCEYKKYNICEKDYIWNISTCICENGKYLASVMDDSVIACNEIIKETIPTNLNEKKTTCKMQNFYILLAFLLITIALLITVSIYCYKTSSQTKIFITISWHK